jgi:hypothetical protein
VVVTMMNKNIGWVPGQPNVPPSSRRCWPMTCTAKSVIHVLIAVSLSSTDSASFQQMHGLCQGLLWF